MNIKTAPLVRFLKVIFCAVGSLNNHETLENISLKANQVKDHQPTQLPIECKYAK